MTKLIDNPPDRLFLEQTFPELRELRVLINDFNDIIDNKIKHLQLIKLDLEIEWGFLVVTLPIMMFFAFIPTLYIYFFSIKKIQQKVNETNEHIHSLRNELWKIESDYRKITIQKLKKIDDDWDKLIKRSTPPTKTVRYPKPYFGKYSPTAKLPLQPARGDVVFFGRFIGH